MAAFNAFHSQAVIVSKQIPTIGKNSQLDSEELSGLEPGSKDLKRISQGTYSFTTLIIVKVFKSL